MPYVSLCHAAPTSAAICSNLHHPTRSCVTWEHQVANLNDSLRALIHVSNPRGKVCKQACMPSARDRVASCSFSHEPLRFPRPISPLGLAIRRYGIMPFSTGGPCPPAMRRWGEKKSLLQEMQATFGDTYMDVRWLFIKSPCSRAVASGLCRKSN